LFYLWITVNDLIWLMDHTLAIISYQRLTGRVQSCNA